MEFCRNPFVTFEEINEIFEVVNQKVGPFEWNKAEVPEFELYVKGMQLAEFIYAKYKVDLYEV